MSYDNYYFPEEFQGSHEDRLTSSYAKHIEDLDDKEKRERVRRDSIKHNRRNCDRYKDNDPLSMDVDDYFYTPKQFLQMKFNKIRQQRIGENGFNYMMSNLEKCKYELDGNIEAQMRSDGFIYFFTFPNGDDYTIHIFFSGNDIKLYGFLRNKKSNGMDEIKFIGNKENAKEFLLSPLGKTGISQLKREYGRSKKKVFLKSCLSALYNDTSMDAESNDGSEELRRQLSLLLLPQRNNKYRQ